MGTFRVSNLCWEDVGFISFFSSECTWWGATSTGFANNDSIYSKYLKFFLQNFKESANSVYK